MFQKCCLRADIWSSFSSKQGQFNGAQGLNHHILAVRTGKVDHGSSQWLGVCRLESKESDGICMLALLIARNYPKTWFQRIWQSIAMLESQGAFYYHVRFAREARTIQQFSTLDNRVQVSWLKLLLRGTPAISNCSDDLVAQFPPRLLLMAPAASRFAATGH